MIPFNLLPVMRPVTRPVFGSLTSGSLLQSRRAGFRTRLAPESLARLFALQPGRLIAAIVMLILLAIGSSALSVRSTARIPVETSTSDQSMTPASDRIDSLDMSRWQL